MFQELALQVTQKAHAGQVDKAGKDLIKPRYVKRK